MSKWRKAAEEVPSVRKEEMEKMTAYMDTLTKPQGSLGRLEELAVKLAGIQGKPDVSRPAVLVFAGDHGVTAEGVSLYGKEVTQLMVHNFVQGGAAINVLAEEIGASVTVTDVGVAGDTLFGSVDAKVKQGTGNIAREAAMTTGEASLAIDAGIEASERAIAQGANLIIPGEMGIGNTTATSALLAAWTGASPEEVTGSGTGVTGEQLQLKQEVIGMALERASWESTLEAFAEIGGLEIAAMSGAMIEAAKNRTPVLIDGFIASIAAMGAVRLAPFTADYFIFGHLSAEAGHKLALETLKAEPLLELKMRLGEGTGAAAAYPLVSMAAAIADRMATFADLGIKQ
ncbi:nicotinate-nucleotide--dimethylbenzimidazole phosphoribosyltransferase [Alkalicoccus halolimnae]|uniref:Nicotinate-nucleotide--dimethylbenzimidazole phosphoribosyltransferase n=1 Tax=Alkalicoccus halolimnae TaxID=1667239 RepID=A0A5C7F3M7_9BACI|nr:nicotinate-nucleotide--dimethylbenzimidazole phosphoribosyltransferase [Alkalicoccus halolimnae]TXF82777.1 nicotinate-nucleotide--dimethylbenzimidazole phosphoribosyltransferase [Alkalicoccus halolimnae]